MTTVFVSKCVEWVRVVWKECERDSSVRENRQGPCQQGAPGESVHIVRRAWRNAAGGIPGAIARWFIGASIALLVAAGCTPPPRNVLFIVVDTLRADHLSIYGYPRPISSEIERLAGDSIVYTDAMSHAPLTVPSILQLFTGAHIADRQIPNDTETLAEILSRNGFQTMATIDNPVLELRSTGIDRGFDDVFMNRVLDKRLEFQHAKTKTPADAITRRAIRWLEERDETRPFFVWLHYFDPHDPYAPPFIGELPFEFTPGSDWTGDVRRYKISRERKVSDPAPVVRAEDRQRLIDLYDAEIDYFDQSLADLIAYLEHNRLYDDTLIVLTSDHGEAFGEHGNWTHGHSLHQSQIQVPLLFKLPRPDTRGEVRTGPVGLIDVVNTVCRYLELDCAGRDAQRDLLHDPANVQYALWKTQVVAREGHWKLIHDEVSGHSQLFDLSTDPNEERDLLGAEPDVVARLIAGKDRWLRETWPSYEDAIRASRRQFQELRSLGYLE